MSSDQARWPSAALPAGACDTHLHFYDQTYPTNPGATLFPPDATPDDYRTLQADLGLERLVVVQPTTYGLDNRCQLQAAATFGSGARSVVVVDHSVDDGELRRLTGLGARGARFHMLRGGAVPWSMLEEVAARIAPFGWHVQLQLNGRELEQRFEQLARLAVPVVVDHIGRFMPPVDPGHPSLEALLALLESGRCWAKLSAPYESSVTGPPGYHDLRPIVDMLVARVPDRLLWASNWPHPGQADAPSSAGMRQLLEDWLPDTDTRHRVLVDNPAELYDF